MKKYVLSIDQGTTSSRAILFDAHGKNCFSARSKLECIYPKSGWVEQDALEIYVSVLNAVSKLLVESNVKYSEIDSIAITNQRETTIVWDKNTGLPVYNAIVWQSRQTAAICERKMDHNDLVHKLTGLQINPYFSASKIRFILDKIPNGQKRAEQGDLYFGTVDSWLIYKLTGNHFTDVTNASRTLLFNIHELKWDDRLLKIFNIPRCMLPEVKPCSYDYGIVKYETSSIHITGVAGDQQASLFGHKCFNVGDSKNTYGTGCFMLTNTGNKPIVSKKGLLTTIAWQIGDKVTYALEGSVYMGGALIDWLKDGIEIISEVSYSDNLAASVDDTNGVYFVPAFVGLATPYWDDDVRGSILGLSRDTKRAHIVRAAIEGIAFQCKDVFDTMEKDANIHLNSLNVDGGATANTFLLQFQADILSTPVNLTQCLETTALGAAYFAGLKTGFFSSTDEIKRCSGVKACYLPKLSKREVNKKYTRWKLAVQSTRTFK